MTYIIPRDNGEVVLGGTAQKHDFTATADPATADSIKRRVCEMYPALAHGKGPEALLVVRHGVGLRPSREGNVRIETERIATLDGKIVIVCHNYGHGGCGYQSSWGAGADAVNHVYLGLTELEHETRKTREFLDKVMPRFLIQSAFTTAPCSPTAPTPARLTRRHGYSSPSLFDNLQGLEVENGQH
ncbi:hypothetical protein BC936DRAFT_142334 [Jimgerdemannia flammicorona]|uniref:FAD dependent oxidoreductase domain-containing protein n=1 Tax=Jimgerdemannia flammicorona TaxID=994334 RepID=A0A433DFA5_9FUNG|nr:hypothetical protein BC936DRAFT_142334 [Jimgerdemannia flammicorona]